MADRAARHFRLSVVLTLLSIAVTEVAHHLLRTDATFSAGLLLLGLVPTAYGALGAGLRAGIVCTLLLSSYVFHFSAPHEALASPAAWRGAAVIFAIGLALSVPMGMMHTRERRFRAAIEERTATLERRNAELTELNAALESFGYVVSHDLKEPVRAIENYLAAAREEWGSEESKRYVVEAHEANRRLTHMLQGLLEYSRTSNLPTTARELSVADVLAHELCRGRYERAYRERGVTLEVAPDLPRVRGDEVLLSQALGNLLLNAALHHNGAASAPVVRVRAEPAPEGHAHIVIEDNGPGYPPEVLSRFDRLPSGHVATVKTGFGLVIAQRALRRIEGELWLENAPGGGARAHVQLPSA